MVSKKIKNRLKQYIQRSCKRKKQYNLFTGILRLLILKKKNNGKPNLYKCSFCNFYHVGNTWKRTSKKIKYYKNVVKRIQIDKELRLLGVKL